MTKWIIHTLDGRIHDVTADDSYSVGGNVVFFAYGPRKRLFRPKKTVAVIPERQIVAVIRGATTEAA